MDEQIREEVLEFAKAMETKLQFYDFLKEGWRNSDKNILLNDIWNAMKSLIEATLTNSELEIQDKAVSIANYAMMLYDNMRKYT